MQQFIVYNSDGVEVESIVSHCGNCVGTPDPNPRDSRAKFCPKEGQNALERFPHILTPEAKDGIRNMIKTEADGFSVCGVANEVYKAYKRQGSKLRFGTNKNIPTTTHSIRLEDPNAPLDIVRSVLDDWQR